MIICDTSGLIAAYSASDRRHPRVTQILAGDPGPLVLSPFVLAEIDYLIESRAGVAAELKVLDDVAAGVYRLADFGLADVSQAAAIVASYSALGIGLADASLVVLAGRYRTTRLLTLDEKHFRAIRPEYGAAFTLLPADS
ncbi:MAG: PIN domain-containing protein [Streptosporangiaceae bacterium]